MQSPVDTLKLPTFKFKYQLKTYLDLENFIFPKQNLVKNDLKFLPKIVQKNNDKTLNRENNIKVVLFFHQNHEKSKALAKFLHRTLKGHNFDKLLDHSISLTKKLHAHDLIKIESVTENTSSPFHIKNLSKLASIKKDSNTQTPNIEKSARADDLRLLNMNKHLNLNDLGIAEECSFCEQNLTKVSLISELKNGFTYQTVDLDKYSFRKSKEITKNLETNFKINSNYAPILQFYQNGELIREFHNIDLVNQLSRENDKRLILECFYQLIVKENTSRYAFQINNVFMAEACHDCKVTVLES